MKKLERDKLLSMDARQRAEVAEVQGPWDARKEQEDYGTHNVEDVQRRMQPKSMYRKVIVNGTYHGQNNEWVAVLCN